jgi:copper(I)-binding protein
MSLMFRLFVAAVLATLLAARATASDDDSVRHLAQHNQPTQHAPRADAGTRTFKAGPLVIEAPWIRGTPPSAPVAGGYMTITNTGTTPDRLVGGTLDQARRFEIHEMTTVDNIMRMRPIPAGLEIKPGETVELKPGGYHIMAMNLQGGYAPGKAVKGTLQFEKAGTVEIEYLVGAIGGGAPAAAHQH